MTQKLSSLGYRGPVGIDGFVYKSGSEYKFQSLSEINPRFTMGRIALELEKHVVAKSSALWLHVSQRMLKNGGYSCFKDLHDELAKKIPLQLKQLPNHAKLIEQGCIATNDIDQSAVMATYLIVAEQPILNSILTKLSGVRHDSIQG